MEDFQNHGYGPRFCCYPLGLCGPTATVRSRQVSYAPRASTTLLRRASLHGIGHRWPMTKMCKVHQSANMCQHVPTIMATLMELILRMLLLPCGCFPILLATGHSEGRYPTIWGLDILDFITSGSTIRGKFLKR